MLTLDVLLRTVALVCLCYCVICSCYIQIHDPTKRLFVSHVVAGIVGISCAMVVWFWEVF